MSNTISALDSSFVSLINNVLTVERQPLVRLTQRRDDIQVQKAIYSDLRRMLDELESSAKSLRTGDPFYALNEGRGVKVSNVASGSTVMTATAGSSAAPGNYNISNIVLAKEHRVFSQRQTYANQALGYTGSFVVGGAADAALTANAGGADDAVESITTSAVAAGQTSLGSDTYTIETRNDPTAGWQFRLVNMAGEAVSILKADGTGSTAEWQSITAGGTQDTGRGLTIQFAADTGAYVAKNRLSAGAATAAYTAKGATIEVTASTSLVDLVSKINQATYADGNKVTASIIDNQMVLTNQRAGENNLIKAADVTGTVLQNLGILNAGGSFLSSQAPTNASMTVNGLSVTRYKNTGLTDVVHGLTINLAPDAQDKSATLEVTTDVSTQKTAVEGFLAKFNSLVEYLNAKVTNIKQTDGTYKRGALAGDNIIVSMRLDLVRMFGASTTNGGTLTMMSQIGINMDSSFKASISDANKFIESLTNDRNNTTALIDAVMSKMGTTLSRFTGSSGYLQNYSTSLQSQIDSTNSQITRMNERLAVREEQLYKQYGDLQAQLMTMQYTSQQFSAIYGKYSTSG